MVGLAVSSAKINAASTVGGSKDATSSPTATDLPLPVEDSTPSPAATKTPIVTPAPKPVGPATFVMPDFTDMDESEVESWFNARNIRVSTEFDYGDDFGSDCEDAGEGIAEDQSPSPGTKLTNAFSTDVYLAVYCDY